MRTIIAILVLADIAYWLCHRAPETPVQVADGFWYEEETIERDGERLTIARWGVE